MLIEESLLPLYIQTYREDKSMLQHIYSITAGIYSITNIYNLLVQNKELIPIESLPKGTKLELINECKGAKDIKQACRIFWTLKYYL